MKKYFSIAALVLVAGCAGTPTTTTTVAAPPASAESRVFAIKTGYQILLVGAVNYNKLPPCERTNASVICRDANVVAILRRTNDAALATLNTAEFIVRAPSVPEATKIMSVNAAENAVKTMETVLATAKK